MLFNIWFRFLTSCLGWLLLLLKKFIRLSKFPSVAIVILNWNGKHYLQQFLSSIISSTYPNYKIVVVDNASTDGSFDLLREEFQEVDVMIFKENLGFAKGYNEALKGMDADYYAILNSDVEVSENWLEPIVELLEQNEVNAACQPKILSYNSKTKFEYAGASGGWLDEYGYPFARGRIFDYCEEDIGQYDKTEEVFWASGAALIIKSKVFHQLQGFDEFFFAHQEEIDLCWRIQLAGKKVFCCPQSVVYHVGGGTLPQGSTRKVYLNFRNNHIMMAKNMHWSEKWWKIPFRILLDLTSALKGLLSGNGEYFAAILKAHIAYYKWLIFSKKNSLSESSRKLSTLTGVFTGNVIWEYFIKKKKRFQDVVR